MQTRPPKPEPPRVELWRNDCPVQVAWLNHDGSKEYTPQYLAWSRKWSMIRWLLFYLFFGAVMGLLLLLTSTAQADVIGVFFSPKGGATAEIVRRIDASEESINCQLYSFTSKPIADALIRAKKRGVKVTLVLDAGANKTAERTQADECVAAGIQVYIDAEHAIAHNKTGIFDNELVLIGSFNWSAAAENSNAETLIAFDDRMAIDQCTENFKQHLAHSKRMTKN